MGFFRRHKADRYTTEEARQMEELARIQVNESALVYEEDDKEFIVKLEEWAAWRELLARKQGDNEGREE